MTIATSGGRQQGRWFAILALLAAVILSTCACGGSAAGGLSQKGQRIRLAALAYSECMRSHGDTGFPDPDSSGNFEVTDTMMSSPGYQSANRACQHLLPVTPMPPAEQARELTRGLKYSACMRAHGLPGFPDPTVNAMGVDFIGGQGAPRPDSAQYQAADRVCEPYLTGARS